MSSCYITALLPFLDPTVPDTKKSNSYKADTVLWVHEDFEIDAELFLYQAGSSPVNNSVSVVIAKFAGDGTEGTVPQLEAITSTPCAGEPSDPGYREHLPQAFAPVFHVTGTVERTSDRKITISGTEFLNGANHPFRIIAEVPNNKRWLKFRLPPLNSLISVVGSLAGYIDNETTKGPLLINVLQITLFTTPTTTSMTPKTKSTRSFFSSPTKRRTLEPNPDEDSAADPPTSPTPAVAFPSSDPNPESSTTGAKRKRQKNK